MIRAYVGLQGSGKTFSMVNDAVRVIQAGLPVVSNVPICTPYGDAILKEGKAFWDAYLHRENTLFVLDEGGILLGKYEWKNITARLWWQILLHRKYGNHLYVGTPAFSDIAIQLRQYVAEAVGCSPINNIVMPFWSFKNIYYDPKYYEYKKEDLPIDFEKQFILKRKFISKFRAKKVFTWYDTKYTVIPSMSETVNIPQPSEEADEDVIGRYL